MSSFARAASVDIENAESRQMTEQSVALLPCDSLQEATTECYLIGMSTN